jgi:thiol-disulfide isomerase/thioredoxin
VVHRWALLCLLGLFVQSAAAGVQVGQSAPQISLPLLAGGSPGVLTLESLQGKVVYLDFWASWCGPCRVSFPQLEALRQELGPQGFEVLAVNVDEFEPDALRFLEEVTVTYPVVWDGAGETPAIYGILGMPTGYLIDRAGTVRLVHQGYRKSDGVALRESIIELLGEQAQ